MVRLIGIDLDETFLDHDKKLIEENIIACREAMDKGIVVMPVTGRPLNSIPEDVKKSVPFRYAISSSGAGVHDLKTGELLFAELMEQEVGMGLTKALCDAGFIVNVIADGTGYINKTDIPKAIEYALSPAFTEYVKKYRTRVDDIFDIIKAHPEGIEKVTAMTERNEQGEMMHMDEAMKAIEPFLPYLDVMYSKEINIEINGIKAKKGGAMLKLAGLLGIKPEETMAIGDSANDLEMIKTVALGVAMDNANQTVKDAADYVTLSNDDAGVAYAIRKWALGMQI